EKSDAEKEEEKKLASLQAKLDAELLKEKRDGIIRNAGTTLALGAVATIVGGAGMGASTLISGAMSAAMAPESGLGARPQIGTQPIPPQRPSDHDISIWLNRLKESDPKKRGTALVELRSLNNPAALPHLGYHFTVDPDPQFRDEVQRTGKSIYY